MSNGPLGKLRERVHETHETAVRVTQLQDEIAHLRREQGEQRAVVGELLAAINELRGAAAHLAGVAENTQRLAGEALWSVNDGRMHGDHEIELARMALGRLEARQLRLSGCTDWRLNQFRVYSQFGEDGLIQLITRELDLPPSLRTFVEFGVEDYREANTRFLLLHDRWRGFVMDGDPANIEALRADPAFRRRDLTAAAAFITRENIDDLLRGNGFAGEIGLLSVDIDGNDFWVWDAITAADPVVVAVEYNYRFGPEAAVVVPYAAAFEKLKAHPSGIYYGASLAAFVALAGRKGYAFVGCSEGGVNAFFVRRDRLPASLPERTAAEGYVAGQHEEMRGPDGAVVRAGFAEQHATLMALPLVEIGPDGREKGMRKG